MIAALYVERNGVYFGLPEVDPWDKARDARLYAGPHPVIAHPPCERWGRYWGGAPWQTDRKTLGDDGGCFAAALAAVRRCGGLIEHPEGSHAWRHFGLNLPPRCGGWVVADWQGGWTCCIEQGHYGHRARKATWLYAHGIELPSLSWGRAPGEFTLLDEGFHSKEERARLIKTGRCQRLSARQRAATPIEFRDMLIAMVAPAAMRGRSMNSPTHAEHGEPKRIQRRRTRGWRMPKDAIYVGRPSRWGNPFSAGKDVVEWFRWWLAGELAADWDSRNGLAVQAEARIKLRGKDLACWCPLSRKCHADVLLEIANDR